MKLKLWRCNICDAWNGAHRDHCKHCSATRTITVNRKMYCYDSTVLRRDNHFLEMVRGSYHSRVIQHLIDN